MENKTNIDLSYLFTADSAVKVRQRYAGSHDI
jgi:hypothetical protein